MRKLMILLSFLLLLCLPLTAYAEPIPEEDRIGETLAVEPDINVIKNNLNDKDFLPEQESKTIVLTEEYYLTTVIRPAALLFAFGIASFAAVQIVKKVLK